MSIEKDKIEPLIEVLLTELGLNISDPGLVRTPHRVAKAWRELTQGYSQDPKEILSTVFPADSYDEMITVSQIEFHSTCEHHLLPFSGYVTIGYIPDKQVVGLSKLVRIVDCFAKRLQIQERLTSQILQALQDNLKPVGAGVHITATHMCMTCRGVKRGKAAMTTTAISGSFKQVPSCRHEFLKVCYSRGR
jgi:GTP cyclohydrolase I